MTSLLPHSRRISSSLPRDPLSILLRGWRQHPWYTTFEKQSPLPSPSSEVRSSFLSTLSDVIIHNPLPYKYGRGQHLKYPLSSPSPLPKRAPPPPRPPPPPISLPLPSPSPLLPASSASSAAGQRLAHRTLQGDALTAKGYTTWLPRVYHALHQGSHAPHYTSQFPHNNTPKTTSGLWSSMVVPLRKGGAREQQWYTGNALTHLRTGAVKQRHTQGAVGPLVQQGRLGAAECQVSSGLRRNGVLSSEWRRGNVSALHLNGKQQNRAFSISMRGGGGWGRGYSSNGEGVLWGLIFLNGLVFLAWQTLDQRFMAKHFMVSAESLQNGRLYTLLTSAFSQKDTGHLLGNLLSLYFFGSEVCLIFGGQFLLTLYVVGGVVASASHVAYFAMKQKHRNNGRWPSRHFLSYSPPAMGASGAVNAIVLFSCLLDPFRIVYLNLILPIPSIALGALFIFQDLYGASSGTSRVGHAAHLGGAAVGIAAWLQLYLRRRRGGRMRF